MPSEKRKTAWKGKGRAGPAKLPAMPGGFNSCLNCPPIQPTLKLNRRIAVGCGYAAVTCDGQVIWSESNEEFHQCWTVRMAEMRARKKPGADWRIALHGPLHGETYQRQGRNRWVLVGRNGGFA